MKISLVPKKWKIGFRRRKKGGAGSGNYGHTGRPGLVGGSGGGLVKGAEVTAIIVDGKRVTGKVKRVTDDSILITYGDGLISWVQPKDIVAKGEPKQLSPPIKVYHGTGEEVVARIRSQGLKAFKADDVDQDIEMMELGTTRPSSVYFTTDRAMAERYAENYGGGFAGAAAIVEIDMPANIFENAIQDELGSPTDYRLQQGIPADWITNVEVQK